jgi:hypothetical protein
MALLQHVKQINATVLEVHIYFLNLYFIQLAIFEKVTKPKICWNI